MILKQFWECQKCLGLLAYKVDDPAKCYTCDPPEPLYVDSADYSANVRRYIEIAKDRTVFVRDHDGKVSMSIGSLRGMR